MKSSNKIENLYHRMLKDYADFIKATGYKPEKILITKTAFSQLKENRQLEKKDGEWYFEGTPVSENNNMNEIWMVI